MGSIPVRVTKNNQSTKGGLIIFAYLPRESKGAVVNDMPAACQSRAPARPQARIPVRVTKNPECESVQDFYFLPFHSSLFTKTHSGFLEVISNSE